MRIYQPKRTTIAVLAALQGKTETEIRSYLKELENHNYIWTEPSADAPEFTIHICAVDPKPTFNQSRN